MKNFKKLTALVLALILTLCMASCGGNEESSTESATSKATSEAASEANSEANSEAGTEESSEAASEETSSAEKKLDTEWMEDLDQSKKIAMAVYGTPKVDAENIDPIWDTAPVYVGESIRPTVSASDTKTRFTFQLMWNDTHFFVLQKVTDSTLSEAGADINWMTDSAEFYFSMSASNETSYGYSEGAFGLTTFNEMYFGATCVLFGDTFEHLKRSVARTDTGYVICFSLDMASMNNIELDIQWEAKNYFGFDLAVNDSVNAGARECCIAWSDTSDRASADPSTFGTVALVAWEDAE